MTPRQEKFCQQYCLSLNGRQAAIDAGYSARTAEVQASRLLRNAKVKTRIAEMLSKASARANIQLADILSELRKIAFSSMGDFARWTEKNVTLTPSDKLSPELLSIVESVSESQDKASNIRIKIKLHSKLRAIDSILKLYELSELEARIARLEERLNEVE